MPQIRNRRRHIRSTRSRRQHLLETLESRQLLSATTLTPEQEVELKSGLDSIESFVDRIDAVPHATSELPFLATSFNEAVDLSQVLAENFVNPLAQFLDGDDTTRGSLADAIEAQDVVDADRGFEFLVGEVQLREQGNEFSFATKLYATQQVDYEVDLGDEAANLGLDFESSQNRAAEFGFAFELAFGIDDAGDFFAEIERVETTVTDTTELIASSAIPEASQLDQPITLTVLINDQTNVTVTLPATTDGNLTPIAQRLTQAFADPLREAGWENALEWTDSKNRLVLRSQSASIDRLQVFGDETLEQLGLTSGQESAAPFTPTLDYGLVRLTSDSGGLAITGTLDVRVDDGADGRLSTTELITTATIATAAIGSGQFLSSVTPSHGTPVAGRPKIRAQAARLFGSPSPSVTTEAFDEIDRLNEEVRSSLREGFATIASFGTRLELETELANSLPGLEASGADLADVDDVLRDKLQSSIENLLTTQPRVTWEQVREALASVPEVSDVQLSENDQSVSLDLELLSTTNSQQPLRYGQLAEDAGFAVNENERPQLNVRSTMDWAFSVELDRALTASTLEAFQTTFDRTDTRFEIDNQALDFDASVGFLSVAVTGQASLNTTHRIDVAGGQTVSAARLLSEDSESLFTTSEIGAADVSLSLSGTLGETTLGASMALTSDDVFSGSKELQPTDFTQVDVFKNLTADDVSGGFAQLSSWFGDFADERLGETIPFSNRSFSDLIDLESLFSDSIVSRLTAEEGQLQFRTVQELTELSESLSLESFDANANELTMLVSIDAPLTETLDADLEFDFELGDFKALSTDASVTLTSDLRIEFRLGIDLRPIGLGDGALLIDEATPLAEINDGMGIPDRDDSEDDLRVSFRDGTELSRIRLDGAQTLGDVLAILNSAAPGRLSAELYDERDVTIGIRLVDLTEGENVFAVRAIEDSLAGVALGIVGEGDDDGSIDGLPLHGDTFANHLFVEETDQPIATGTVELRADTFDATANLGFTEVSINAGAIQQPSSVSASVGLSQPRMTAAELFQSLSADAQAGVEALAELAGQIDLQLPTFAVFSDGPDEGSEEDVQSSTVLVSVSEFGDDFAAEVSGFADSVLEQLTQIDVGDVLDGLRTGLGRLLSYEGLSIPFLGVDLPSAAGLESLLSRVEYAIDSIGGASLDVLSAGINRLANVGLSPSDESYQRIDFPEISVSLSQLFSFFESASEIAPAEDTSDTLSLPDLESLLRDSFGFEITLPSVTVSAEQFADYLNDLRSIADELSLAGPGSLQALEQVLEDAIGLDASKGQGIGLQIITDPSSLEDPAPGPPPTAIEIRFDMDLGQDIEASYPLSVDLADLGINGVGDLVDVGGSSTVILQAGVSGRVSLGLNISSGDETVVTPFLYTNAGGTSLTLSAGATAEDIDFEASLGPLGIGIVGGVAGINASGLVGDSNPATFTISLDDQGTNASDGRYLFGDQLSFDVETTGGVYAALPVELPLGSPLTTIEFSAIGNDIELGQLTDSNFNEIDDVIQAKINEIASAGIGENLLSLVGGWEGAFDLLTDTMRGDVLGVPLPFIGEALADEADFLDEIKRSVLDNLENLAELGTGIVQTEIFNALGPGGLDLLQDQPPTGDGVVTADDVIAVVDVENDRVDFDLKLAKATEAIALPIDFDLGLPGLNLDIDAPVELQFGFEFDLGFGVGITEGFYFDTEDTQLVVSFTADVAELDARGELALLDIEATSGTDEFEVAETFFGGQFIVDLVEPNPVDAEDARRLTLSEMFAGDFSDVVQHELNAEAFANLAVIASIGESKVLPSIRTDLLLHWQQGSGFDFGIEDRTPTPAEQLEVTPENPIAVEFANVEMNIGEFFGGFAGDVLGRVQDVLQPVQPVIDVLTQRLPVISDLGGSNVTLVDLARLFGRADVADFLQSVIDVNDLINSLPNPASLTGDAAWLPLGEFQIDASALGGFAGESEDGSVKEITIPDFNAEDTLGALESRGGQGGRWKNNLQGAKGSLSFPLLESPINAFNLLIGKDVDLFLYDAPALGVDFSYSQSFPTPIPGLFAEFGGRIAAVADFAFGMDTTGISKFKDTGFVPDLFDGFFVSDRANADGTGRDVPEVYLRGSLTAGAKIDLLLAEAGVRGGIYADVNFNLNDGDRDGRVRAREIADSIELGPIHIFDVDGRVDAGLTAFYRFLFFEDEFEIARVNLLNFEVARPTGALQDPLATQAGEVLTVQFSNGDDDYQILPGQTAGSIIVQGNNQQSREFVGVSSIIGNAGAGDDVVTVSPNVLLPVTISGGIGDDQLTAGGGHTTFYGNDGNDSLTGGSGDDQLFGGAGADVIIGGEGDDEIDGGSGNDYLDGARGFDVILGSQGDDQLFGGFDDDVIEGGDGDDVIDGGRGNDELIGGRGNDRIEGGRGDDKIDGGDGNDELFGQDGADEIDGAAGVDEIDGGDRNDVLRGGAGEDIIVGGRGNDEIYGGDDADTIRGSGGSDRLFGDAGDDLLFADSDELGDELSADHFIDAGTGKDTVFGSRGDDVIIGGLGDDELRGLGGSDVVWGGFAAHDAQQFDLSDNARFEKPPRFDEATLIGGSTYVLPRLIAPRVVAGLSVPGNTLDGNDTLYGGGGIDFLFGGGGEDSIFGGAEQDYIDGGAGNDRSLFGDAGDDIVRGGLGDDALRGGLGIDQLYGDSGRDELRGESGDASGSTNGQRLFGGDGIDTLHAWAGPNPGTKGDELYGEGGGDFLYGAHQNEVLFGEGGADYLLGGAGDDVIDGGSGQDQAYGGDGDDVLRGGGDGDWLEGEDGIDHLFGGSGIDFLVLDVDPSYETLGGGTFDGHGDSTIADDNATDVMLINGTTDDDFITFSGTPDRRLRVSYTNGSTDVDIDVDWTRQNESGEVVGLVEQFRVSTGLGDDTISFDESLDLTPLSTRSRDFVTVINAGPGDDTIRGSGARDRIDGGRGNDTLFGFGGDDRLWGDQGPGDGSSLDHDVIYAGQGNDDVLGGQGTNDLYAWSVDPGTVDPNPDPSFGVIDPLTSELEDTGLNRIIGGPRNDQLFGGTGLDLLFGGEGDNTLFTRTGERFESLDGGDGNQAWKDYAKSTNQAWYIGGTNGDDLITVSFVTEPGILQGHHLVTRLTNNNGFFTFDAQVRLDFAATDEDGNLVWDPDAVFAGGDLNDADPFARAEALNARFSDAVSMSRLLPPEDDFRAIIIDALDGDDIVNVGPTVQKTVWVDAGDGNDVVTMVSGRSILIDQTDPVTQRNDDEASAFALEGTPVLVGRAASVTGGQLAEDAIFDLIVDDLSEHVRITLPSSATDGSEPGTLPNETLQDLIDDLNRVLNQTDAAGRVIATRAGSAIALSTVTLSPQSRLSLIADPTGAAVTQLGLPAEASAEPAPVLSRSIRFTGLTIDNPSDVDFYTFLVPEGVTFSSSLTSIGVDDGLVLEVSEGETVDGLTEYQLRVQSNLIPTVYELELDFQDELTPIVSDLAAIVPFERQDVLFGGLGDDVLTGGPGEDFIFGGPGNDIVTGGNDRGASDLLFGQAGNDKFQIVPAPLPTLTGTSTTFLPTQSDRFDGGQGTDTVVYLGGDVDEEGLPVSDFVSLRSNWLLQRYEVSSYVWDTANQDFANDPDDATEKLRYWHFFTTTQIEDAVVDLQDGDDVFRSDGGIPFDGSDEEWGISSGDAQATGGQLLNFRIIGGPGNDRLFGTSNEDVLIGGDGLDFIAGGLGDDVIDGGPQDDLLSGENILSPDDFEYTSRGGVQGSNDTRDFAATLPSLIEGFAIDGLTFHLGDQSDNYIFKALNDTSFQNQALAVDIFDRLTVGVTRFGDAEIEFESIPFALQPAINAGTDEDPSWEVFDPQERRTPDAFFLTIDYPSFLAGSPTAGEEISYEIRFETISPRPPLNVAIDALTEDPLTGFSRSPIEMGDGAAGAGAVIPVGDFNGDGHADYVLSHRSRAFDPDLGFFLQYAYLYFGGPDTLLDPTAEELSNLEVTRLTLPGTLAIPVGDENTAQFGSAGDLDGDGFDDIVLGSSSNGRAQLYLYFGSDQFLPELSLNPVDNPNRVASLTGQSESVFQILGSAADLDGDGNDELVLAARQESSQPRLLYYNARSRDAWINEPFTLDSFDGNLGNFLGNHLAPLGDMDGDGDEDFGVLNDNQLLVIRSINPLETSLITSPVTDGFEGSKIVAAGDYNGDGFDDVVISGASGESILRGSDTSFVVDGGAPGSEQLHEVSAPFLRPIGDFSGDGTTDFAIQRADAVEDTFFVALDVYFADDASELTARLFGTTRNPNLTLKSDRSLELISTFQLALVQQVASYGNVGDLNGDGTDDLLVFSPNQTDFSVLYGAPLAPTSSTGGSGEPDPLFSAELSIIPPLTRAWQTTLTREESLARPVFNVLMPEGRSLVGAVTVDGGIEDVELAGARAIGDINGDGIMDLAFENEEADFLVLGPFRDLNDVSIDQLSAVAVRESSASNPNGLVNLDGRIATGFGDFDGDDVDDLLIHRHTQTNASSRTVDVEINRPNGVTLQSYSFTGQVDEQFSSKVAATNWDGGDRMEFLVSLENATTSRIAYVDDYESQIAATSFYLDSNRLASIAPEFTEFNSAARFNAFVAGDINGDGLDDIAVTSANLWNPTSQSERDTELPYQTGAVFFVMGGQHGEIDLASSADHVLIVPGGASRVDAVGDLDDDGFDEFVVYRSIEGADGIRGKALLYQGTSDWNDRGSVSPAPWLTVSQGAVPEGLGIADGGTFRLAFGDLNSDGTTEMYVGSSFKETVLLSNFDVVLERSRRGELGVFNDLSQTALEADGVPITLSDASLIYEGLNRTEQLGVIAQPTLMDFNADGIDDLWVGSSTLDSGRGGVRFLPGVSSVDARPSANEPVVPLANRDAFTVRPSSGARVQFGVNSFDDTESEFRLSAEQTEVWFRFVTAGDGDPQSDVRVIANQVERGLRIDVVDGSGRVIDQGQTRVNLRNEKAGQFFVHVYRDPATPTDQVIDFVLEINAPTLGHSHVESDNDRIFGGDGDDLLVGGAAGDRMRGESGADRFVSENSWEAGDAQTFAGDAEETIRSIHPARDTRTDAVVVPGPEMPEAIRVAIANALGHPVVVNRFGESVTQTPWLASKLAQIELLDLSGMDLSTTAGLELLPNLQFVDLSNNRLTSFPTNLPSVRSLQLDGNQIRDLTPLADIQVIDATDPSVVAAGDWQSEIGADENAWRGGFRYNKSGGSLTWTLNADPGQSYDLFASWPVLTIDNPEEVTFVVSGIVGDDLTVPVLQTLAPGAQSNLEGEFVLFGGVPWERLGRVTPLADQITLTLSGVDEQPTSADAIRLQPTSTPVLNLERLTLTDNPVSDHSRDEVLPRVLAVNPALDVHLSDPGTAPLLRGQEAVTARHRSLDFNGAEDVAVLPNEIMNGLESFLVEFWFQTDTVGSRVILSGSRDGNNEFYVWVTDAETIQVALQNTAYNFDTGGQPLQSVWNHIAVVRDVEDERLEVFLNGKSLVPSTNNPLLITAPLVIANGGLVLGQDQDAVNGGYNPAQATNGRIDELRFWDPFWLSSGQSIEQHLHENRDRTIDGNHPDLRAYYQFDSSHPDLIFDSSDNGRTGELGDFTGDSNDDGTRPSRGSNAPVFDQTIVDLSNSVISSEGDVSFSAYVDDPSVTSRVDGDELSLQYRADLAPGSLRVNVVASAPTGGSESFLGFDFNTTGTSPTDLYRYGTVFVDANQNGIRDPGEVAVPGATIFMQGSDGGIIACTSTDHSGQYRFLARPQSGFAPIQVQLPAKYKEVSVDPDDLVYEYDFSVSPFDDRFLDLDGNSRNDLDDNGGPTLTDGSLHLRQDQSVGGNDETTTLWPTLLPTVESGYTVEFDLKIDSVLAEGTRGAFGIALSLDESSINVLLEIGKNSVYWRTDSGPILLSTDDNTDTFHRFQIVHTPGAANEFFLFRDGELLNPTSAPLSGYQLFFFSTDRLWLGDFSSSSTQQGASLMDRLRIYKGANGLGGASPRPTDFSNLPFASATDFGVRQRIDVGEDRIGFVDEPQTFGVQLESSGPAPTWTVRRDSEIVLTIIDNELTFTPTEIGDYTVTATDGVSTEVFDQLLFRVIPQVDEPPAIDFLLESGATGPEFGEGTPIQLSVDPDTFGLASTPSLYTWTVNDAVAATTDVPNWSFIPPDEGDFEIVVIASDESQSLFSQTLLLQPSNVEPSLSLTSLPDSVGDTPIVVDGSFTDPGTDAWLATADFGDGTQRPIVLKDDRTFRVEHQYSEPGTYRVTVTIDDQDGGSTSQSFDVTADPIRPSQFAPLPMIPENLDTSLGSVSIAVLDVIDETPDDTHQFNFVDGLGSQDNARFEIVGDTLFVRAGEQIDFETKPLYHIRVQAIDSSGNPFEQSLVINVKDETVVRSVEIGGPTSGKPEQRSKVERLEITIDGDVEFLPGAIQVSRRGSTGFVATQLETRLVGTDTVAIVTFFGDAVRPGTVALDDGNYQLDIDASLVRKRESDEVLDGDGDGIEGGDFQFGNQENDRFFSYFGDLNGNRNIGVDELREFRSAFRSGPLDAAFNELFDIDGDGQIDVTEFGQIRERLAETLDFE
ncbi:MAG: LamG-like jellyroll fold domain-containing protein [Planctomycetota bacterium]